MNTCTIVGKLIRASNSQKCHFMDTTLAEKNTKNTTHSVDVLGHVGDIGAIL